jgi:hypothetical protein
MKEQALEWLQKQLKKKRIALDKAESKPNTPQVELDNIQSAIDSIEWIIAEIMKGDWNEI